MATDDARKNLHQWLDDLNALRPFVGQANPQLADFDDAWSVALERAKRAAKDYAISVRAPT
jgi:hypothetical protein